MQTHQYIWKYLQQHRGGRFVVKIGLGVVVALAFFAATFGMGAQEAHAQVHIEGSISAPVSSAPVQSSVSVSYSAAAPAAPQGSSVATIISQVFGSYAATATAIARCESGLNPGVTNPYSGAAGVFQIMPGTWVGTSWAGYSPYNAWANINAAYQIFVRDGYSWREWVC